LLAPPLWLTAGLVLLIARIHPELHRLLLATSSGATVSAFRERIAAWGPWAGLASILLTVLLTFLPFPSDPLIIAAPQP
jgi:hypothetical protein